MTGEDKSNAQGQYKVRATALLGELEGVVNTHDRTIPVILPFLSIILNVAGIIALIAFMTMSNTSSTYYNTGYNTGYYIDGEASGTDYYGSRDAYSTTPVVDTSTVSAVWIIAIALASMAAVIYLIYRWIDARNRHFERTTRLYTIAAEIAEIIRLDRVALIKSRLNELLIVNGNKKNNALHMVLGAIVPFYMLYIMHFMNKDLARHSQHERLLLAEVMEDMKVKDPMLAKGILDYKGVEERSTFLYIVLGVVTLGIFMLYWAYAITRDYNAHVTNHRIMDYEILQSLRRIIDTHLTN